MIPAEENPNLTHAEKQLVKSAYGVFYVKAGDQNSQPAYLYISMMISKLPYFRAILKSGKVFDPSKFGRILACGHGEPDEELKQKLEQEFGFSHANIITLEQ